MERQGYILVLRWPPGYCAKVPTNECSGPERWVINGLWPVPLRSSSSKNLQFCCTQQQFSIQQVESILVDLQKNWPPESYTSATQYWNDEWRQYGSCGHDPIRSVHDKYDPINMAEYFAMALDLYHRIPIQKWLESNWIIPNQSYRPEKIEQILDQRLQDEGTTGGRPYRLGCYHHSKNSSKNFMIWNEIRICFDDHLNPKDCGLFSTPSEPNFECSNNHQLYLIRKDFQNAFGN